MKTKFTTVLHQAREKLGLTIHEYCVADSIYHLSNSPTANKGWCYAGKESLGNTIGISRQSVHSILVYLIAKGIIEKNTNPKYIRTTEKWYSAVVSEKLASVKKLDTTVKNLDTKSKESLHNIYNNIYNNNNTTLTSSILPDTLGSTSIRRITRVYSLVWSKKYGFKPDLNWGMIGSLVKKLLVNHSEYQIASYIFTHFDWHGTSGTDDFTHNRLSERAFAFELMPKAVNEYKAYIINIMKVDLTDTEATKTYVDRVLKQYGIQT